VINGKLFEVSGSGYEPKGSIALMGKEIIPKNHPELLLAGRVAAFCANADISLASEEKLWHVAGDPTEASLLVFAQKLGVSKNELEKEAPLVEEIPFDYKTKYHGTIHSLNAEKAFLTVVGAPEKIMLLCEQIWQKGEEQSLTKKRRENLDSLFISLVSQGFRVLAFALKEFPRSQMGNPDVFTNLTFGGFYAMRDALRPGAKEALVKLRDAGIKPVMITGDHALTAQAMAKEIGIWDENGAVLTGEEIDSLPPEKLSRRIPHIAVFARVTPEHKLKIIQAYKRRGEIVAMTGDGVNDAPSLVAADLGVAMGTIGTEVAKEAADIVLLDDDIESIVGAVEEGRSIYKTIKKVILYLFSTSVGEVMTIGGALILGYPLPLLPGQILWLNLVTDGFLDVALAMEPKEKGLLRGKFKRSRYLVDRLMMARIIVMALPMMIGTLLLFAFYLKYDFQKALTISLTVLAVFQWLNAWNCRSEEKSVFKLNPFSNKFLAGASLIVIFLQLGAIYTPIGQTILHTTPLSLGDWLVIVPVALSILVAEEMRKSIYRMANSKSQIPLTSKASVLRRQNHK
ncbi:MAG: HAD-IC family P-type ATPase, partial [Candidatus Portnoybacteria bacterium]|nr:HAD-IC family P-type ATPase [Candidatus Portnoybacteria bacterium]